MCPYPFPVILRQNKVQAATKPREGEGGVSHGLNYFFAVSVKLQACFKHTDLSA